MADLESPRAPVGMHDVVFPESARWEELIARFSARARRAGFGLLITPVVEESRVFRRGIGEQSDVVGKEMYELVDRGGRDLALRPEGTAPVVRALVQHRPPLPWRVWYATPAFRYERPQAGRYRQHHQLGLEVLGTEDPDVDVEVISFATGFVTELGLPGVSLALNSMGCQRCRPPYVKVLHGYLLERRDALCDDHRRRLDSGPLRVLDCKRDQCRGATADAPRLVDALCEDCESHLARVREGLESLGVDHRIESRLVRGFDYYTRTTFELSSTSLEAAQNAVGGGGRYDGLAEQLGGSPTPGIGFGMGIERLLLACDATGAFQRPRPVPEVFVVDVTGGEIARDMVASLRAAGVSAMRAYDRKSLKAQLRLADRSGAPIAWIVGPDERASGSVTVRSLRQGGGQVLLTWKDALEGMTGRTRQGGSALHDQPERVDRDKGGYE